MLCGVFSLHTLTPQEQSIIMLYYYVKNETVFRGNQVHVWKELDSFFLIITKKHVNSATLQLYHILLSLSNKNMRYFRIITLFALIHLFLKLSRSFPLYHPAFNYPPILHERTQLILGGTFLASL